jgi:hypothetical protein
MTRSPTHNFLSLNVAIITLINCPNAGCAGKSSERMHVEISIVYPLLIDMHATDAGVNTLATVGHQ